MVKYKEMYDLSLKHVDDVKRQIMQSVCIAKAARRARAYV